MSVKAIREALAARFGDAPAVPKDIAGADLLCRIAQRGSCRSFQDRAVAPDLMDTLCALALSSPSKSDLQQRDIVQIRDPALLAQVQGFLAPQPWTGAVPHLLIFCGNNRRQRQLHGWRGHAFANDHLDAFFNATADAAIALATFVTAAEAAGLGCCPISTVRNHAEDISALIGLPDHVFPLAGVAVGYPSADTPAISMRLPLRTTVHIDRFDDAQIQQDVADYDARRLARAPYAQQRSPERFGTAERYTWSEEKARQYALPERTGFGEFIRRIGFRLD